MGYSVVHLEDIEPGGAGGAVRFVRRELEVSAFAIVGARRGGYEARGPF